MTTTNETTTEKDTCCFLMRIRDEHVNHSSSAVENLYRAAIAVGFEVDEIEYTDMCRGSVSQCFTGSGPTEKIVPWLEKMCKEGSHLWYDWYFHLKAGKSFHWIQNGRDEPTFKGHASDDFLSEIIGEGMNLVDEWCPGIHQYN